MKNKKPVLVILDTHAIIHRAYHALPAFTNKKGEPTGALYGLLTMLIRIISTFKPDYLVACYDLPKKTFRHIAYADYKGKRAKSDPELVSQIISSRFLLEAMSIPIIEKEGFEADDMIGSIVEKIKKENLEIIIASGDMDTIQLLEKNNRIKIYTLKKGINDTTIIGYTEAVEKYGFIPDLIPDYKGLRGDPSDNIIGVKGIGDKTATELLVNFGTIEKIYSALEKNTAQLKDKGFSERIIKLLQESKEEALFSKILATIRRDAPIDNFQLENTWQENINLEKITQFCHDNDFKKPLSQIQELFGAKKQEIIISANFEITEDKQEEFKIMAWILDSENSNPDLDQFVQISKAQNIKEFENYLIQELVKTEQIKVWEEIEKPLIPILKKMKETGIRIDTKYLGELLIEYNKLLADYEKQIYSLTNKEFNIRSPKQISDVLFNDLKLPTKGIKKNPSGGFSTNEENLEKLLGEHPVIPLLLSYREIHKITSTYLETLPSFVKEDGRIHADFLQAGTSTGRFSSLNPNLQNIPIKSDWGVKIRKAFIAKEGYSIATFDYSQIELRVAAIMSKDKYLEKVFKDGLDIHQAVASKIFSVPINEVTKDMRIKAKTINFGVLYGMGVTSLQKNLGVSRQEAQIFYNSYFENFIELSSFFEKLKSDAFKSGYSKTLFGRRRYLPGLKSKIPFIKAASERIAVNAPIQGTATADIIKLSIKNVDDYIQKNNLNQDVKIVMQIHDELVFEIKDSVIKDVTLKIKEIMENVLADSFLDTKTEIPLIVNFGYGENWLSGK